MRKTVLVVDDNSASRAIHTTALEHAGYRVFDAADGREALKKAHWDRLDLVLLDLMMPGLDGLIVRERLAADPFTRDVPVVLVTAYDDVVDLDRFRAGGFAALLRKPIGPHTVVDVVRALIGPPTDAGGGPRADDAGHARGAPEPLTR